MARKAATSTAKRATAKKTAARTAGTARTATRTAKRSSAKRERVDTGSDVRYAKRDTSGQWTEMDDAARSQRVDRRRAAKTVVAPGYGDQGDQRRTTKRAAKKR